MEKYIIPEVFYTEIDLTSFLCASIQDMNFTLEVDEYVNTGEDVLTFDSDY